MVILGIILFFLFFLCFIGVTDYIGASFILYCLFFITIIIFGLVILMDCYLFLHWLNNFLKGKEPEPYAEYLKSLSPFKEPISKEEYLVEYKKLKKNEMSLILYANIIVAIICIPYIIWMLISTIK